MVDIVFFIQLRTRNVFVKYFQFRFGNIIKFSLQGVYALAIYVHYFTAGSLKTHTKRYTVKLGHLRELIDDPYVRDPLRFVPTRRWLPKGEAPYPGYCRAPGSEVCVPTLCNCDKLRDRWNMININKQRQNKTKEMQTQIAFIIILIKNNLIQPSRIKFEVRIHLSCIICVVQFTKYLY